MPREVTAHSTVPKFVDLWPAIPPFIYSYVVRRPAVLTEDLYRLLRSYKQRLR